MPDKQNKNKQKKNESPQAHGDHQQRAIAQQRTMPSDYAISLGAKGGTNRLLVDPGGTRTQSMRGFEESYVDIVDYIVRITHRIWEEKDIGYIYDTYKHNSQVVDGVGLQYGRDKIVADTVHTINAFPDIRLYADEVIWAGDDEVGFHTSHRTVIKGHNTGFSRYDRLPVGASSSGALPTVLCWKMKYLKNGYCTITLIWCGSSGLICVRWRGPIGNQREDDQISAPAFEPERLPGQGKPPHLVYQPGQSFDCSRFPAHHLPQHLESPYVADCYRVARTEFTYVEFQWPTFLRSSSIPDFSSLPFSDVPRFGVSDR